MHILFLNVSARNLTCRIGPVCMACTNTIIVHIQSFPPFPFPRTQTVTQPSTTHKLLNQEFMVVC